MNTTIDYYNNNAEEFCENTVNADVSNLYTLFEKYLNSNTSILDCGCGSGRDSKYFLEKGYKVTALDGSIELCKKAKELTGLDVLCMYFQDIDFTNEFDGVWACSSLLHVSRSDLVTVFKKLYNSLKNGGVLYASFKYGDFEGDRNGRFFTDMNEELFNEILEQVKGFTVKEQYITSDVRPGRENEKWFNIIIKKAGN